MELTLTDRVKMVMEHLKLSPSAFADSIEIKRPIISHILSGRNKPSIDIIQKIIQNHTSINPLWLLNAQGNMLQLNLFETEAQTKKEDSAKKQAEKTSKKAKESNKSSTNFVKSVLISNALDEDFEYPTPNRPAKEIIIENEPSNTNSEQKESIENKLEKEIQAIENKQSAKTSYSEIKNIEVIKTSTPIIEQEINQPIENHTEKAIFEGMMSGKKIERIVIFYSDKTFSVYNPE